MSFFRRALRRVADSPLGDRLRTHLNYRPPIDIRPWHSDASVSDLFPWRVDGTWQTRFEITNTPSFLFPNKALSDDVTLVAFRNDGNEIDRQQMTLAPFESRYCYLADIVGSDNGSVGTFAVFHHALQAESILKNSNSHLAERGYVSFKRNNDALWAVVHGNLHCLSKSPGSQKIDFVHGRVTNAEPYRLQLDMSDCRSFDLTFTNPSSEPQALDVVYLSETRDELKRESRVVQPRGIEVFQWDNDKQICTLCEAWGALPMWRPAIFKHYDSHFNVLHA